MIDTKNENSPTHLLAVAEWNPPERIGRERPSIEIEYPPASRGCDKPAFATPFAVVVHSRVMLSVALLVNLDGFNSALRSEHGVVSIDLGAFANRSLTEGAGLLVIIRRRFALRHGITPFLCSLAMGLSRSDGYVSEICTDLLAAFFFLSLAVGVGVVGYKGVRIVNWQAITAELRRLDGMHFGRR